MAYRLRLLREKDLDTVMRWRMQPEVTRYMYTDPMITHEGQRAWFERVSRSEHDRVWIIETVAVDEQPAQSLGVLSLSDIDLVHRRCAWAYYLGDGSARGIGLAKSLELSICQHVFETMGMNKLWCEVLAFNDRVVALHERFGSQVEGLLRAHICKGGEYHDVVRMSLLRCDWESHRGRWHYTPLDIESPPALIQTA
jgi:UDP-4-amino-4,6-dideoxy-N-acetyl-beta-L-altrosamine N-acetyltransferase